MKQTSMKMMKKGMAVTFNYGKDAKGNPIKRTGVFKKWSGQYETKAIVIWKKDDEDLASSHYVSYQALHTPEIDALEARQAKAEAEAKAERKAEREQKALERKVEKEQKTTAKKSVAVAQKSSKKLTHAKTECAQAKALRALADALQAASDAGLDLTKIKF